MPNKTLLSLLVLQTVTSQFEHIEHIIYTLNFILQYRRAACKDFIIEVMGGELVRAQKILSRILLEKKREDRHFVKLEFNVRDKGVVMNYVYDGATGGADVHRPSHDKDPEVLDLDTFDELKPLLYEKNIPFNERRDDFI